MENELSCSNYGLMMELSTEQLTNCYFHNNWENSNDQNDPFESAYSSMVSSPSTTPIPSSSNGGEDGMMIRELIGRLGSICDSSGEILPPKEKNTSTNTSCKSTPLNSPSKLNLTSLMIKGNNLGANHNHNLHYPANLGSFNSDPGFVDRAAKFSYFGNVNNSINHNFGGNNVNQSRVNSEKKLVNNICGVLISSTENNGDSREASSVTGQNPSIELEGKSQKSANSRKRKSISKDKFKDNTCTPSTTDDKGEGKIEESDAKRSKVENEENKKENEEESNTIACVEKQNNNNNNNDDNNNDNDRKEAQKLEPPKDYIHVRARRGQATDSHSLAERVRREKISERMKFLQDLVPGCNKVTGKATVLDEIINYVQSLQRQVEFLSMKLSTVNSRIEFNMEALLSKDLFQSRGSSLPQTVYPSDQSSAEGFHFGYQSTREMSLAFSNGDSNQSSYSVNHMNLAGIRRNPSVPLPSVDGFVDYMSQLPTLWEDDLQSIVQMGIFPNQTQGVSGTLPNAP